MLSPHYSFQKGLPSERQLATNYGEENKTFTHRLINRPEGNGTTRMQASRERMEQRPSVIWGLWGTFPYTEKKKIKKKQVA